MPSTAFKTAHSDTCNHGANCLFENIILSKMYSPNYLSLSPWDHGLDGKYNILVNSGCTECDKINVYILLFHLDSEL